MEDLLEGGEASCRDGGEVPGTTPTPPLLQSACRKPPLRQRPRPLLGGQKDADNGTAETKGRLQARSPPKEAILLVHDQTDEQQIC